MELGTEGHLLDTVQGGGVTLKEETVSVLCRYLLSALEHIHGMGVIHRDIKPENIVLVHVSVGGGRDCPNCVILERRAWAEWGNCARPSPGHRCTSPPNC